MVSRPSGRFHFVLRICPILRSDGEGFTWEVALTLAAWGILAAAAFVTGLISIIKSKERSILVFLAVILGVFFLILILGEFLVPH